MNSFIIRAELHGVPISDSRRIYDSFHQALRLHDIVRTVVGWSGKISELPTGTYYVRCAREIEFVRELVGIVAMGLGFQSSIIVCRIDSWASQGLPEVAMPM